MRRCASHMLGLSLFVLGFTLPAHPQSRAERPDWYAGITITVNTSNDSDTPDKELSLREALYLAGNGSNNPLMAPHCFTDSEKAQAPAANWLLAPPGPFCSYNPFIESRWVLALVFPGVGWEYRDSIVFTSNVDTIRIASPLPAVPPNDDINGDRGGGLKVRLLAVSATSLNGLALNDNQGGDLVSTFSHIRNLTIQNFPGHGITAYGCVRGAVFQGLEILASGLSGINLPAQYEASMKSPCNPQAYIGGTNPSDRNYIYGNGGDGITVTGDLGADYTGNYDNFDITIANNFIGVDPLGRAYGNKGNGVQLQNARGVTVGGDTAASRNIISGNTAEGILLRFIATCNNKIYSNYIGVNVDGSARMGNGGYGVALVNGAGNSTCAGNRIGDPGKGNVIAGNNYGVYISDPSTDGNNVFANMIGTNFSSAAGLGNITAGVGIYFGAKGNNIGGYDSGYGNIISGNAGYGIDIADAGTQDNMVLGNLIGLGADGLSALGNFTGIRVRNGASGNSIGSQKAADRNVISGNSSDGIYIGGSGTGTNQNIVYGNLIGWDYKYLSRLANGGSGIRLDSGSGNTQVIGDEIASNYSTGILVLPGTSGNRFHFLSLTYNRQFGGLGIDLQNPIGVGCNDGAAGGNQCSPAPSITQVGSTQGSGTSSPSAWIDLYLAASDPSGYGERRTYISSTTANASGQWVYSFFGQNLCTLYGSPIQLTATSTIAGGTSEFSKTVNLSCKIFFPFVVH